jgi:DNA repair exonuclease SbcCD nuclease subunit
VEENVIKILLATDNHIGYLERDPIRGQDSINTFKEILELAIKHEVRRHTPYSGLFAVLTSSGDVAGCRLT